MIPSIPMQEIRLALQDIDWNTVDRLEIRGAKDISDSNGEYSRTEEENINPDYYSVFLHQEFGSSWIADEPTLQGARDYAASLAQEHELFTKEFV